MLVHSVTSLVHSSVSICQSVTYLVSFAVDLSIAVSERANGCTASARFTYRSNANDVISHLHTRHLGGTCRDPESILTYKGNERRA